MTRLFVHPRFAALAAELGWHDFAAVFRQCRPDYQRRGKVSVQRVLLASSGGPVPAFFKVYHHQASGWAFLFRRSKARCEFDNYAVFDRLGVPCAEVIACGEERNALGKLERAFILTRALANVIELDKFFREQPPRATRRVLANELAGVARRLHAAGFAHGDFVWRNVLVQRARPERLFLIDCPRGTEHGRLPARERLRDIASLDKSAVKHCSRSERLRFLLAYLGKTRPDEESRTFIRQCLAFRRRRWPEDWQGK